MNDRSRSEAEQRVIHELSKLGVDLDIICAFLKRQIESEKDINDLYKSPESNLEIIDRKTELVHAQYLIHILSKPIDKNFPSQD